MPAGHTASPVHRLQSAWQGLSPLPGGKWLFSRLLGWMVPYTGSIGATVLELAPGRARVELRDRRRVRNHLDCIHAVALANLGEIASGLATLYGLPPGYRGILTGLAIEYHKKARGRLVAECQSRIEGPGGEIEHVAHADIHDDVGDLVAHVTATWRLGPEKQ